MLATLLFLIQNSWQLSLLELPFLLSLCFFLRFHTYQLCDFLLGFLQLVYLHCSIWPPLANAALAPTLAFKPLILFLPTSYLFPVHPHHCLMLLAVSLYPSFLFPSLTLSEFFNGMLGVSKQGELNFYTLFRLIPLIIFVSRNLTSSYLSLSVSLDSLLCDLIAATPDLVFFLLMLQTLAAASSSYSSDRAYPSVSFLLPLFLCLTPTLIM